MSLQGKDILSIHDLTIAEVEEILAVAKELKDKQRRGQEHHLLKGKTLGMIFQKASTRTRVSFEVGMWQLGGNALFLSSQDSQIGRGEPVKDTARVLSRYVDGIMIRTFSHDEVEELARYAAVPVINGLTDKLHPCQALTDIYTVLEQKKELAGRTLAYIGDGNNMVHALMQACAKVGMNINVATPRGYEPDAVIVEEAQQDALATNCRIALYNDPLLAARDADVLYTDVWASMGQESEQQVREKAFSGFIINAETVAQAKRDVIIMHCLPAHRGEEITDDVIEGPQSVVFDQAENRLHVQKAILALVMGNKKI